MAPIYERLQRLKESEAEARMGSNPVKVPRSGAHGESELVGGVLQPSRNDSVTSATANTDRTSWRQRSDGFDHNGLNDEPPLSIVPDIYFKHDFHLENPRTFHVVSERSEIMAQTPRGEITNDENTLAPRKLLATNSILQEKLSWYMDIVELHLANSISMVSATAFSVLGSLRELHSEAADSAEKITTLRKDLASLQRDVVAKGLVLSEKRQVHQNIQHINDAVLQLKCILNRVSRCKSLVDEGEAEKALTEFDTIDLLMSGEHSEAVEDEISAHIQLHDIREAVALQGVVSDISVLRSRVANIFASRIHSILIQDLQRHTQSVSKQEVLLRWGSTSQGSQEGYQQGPSALLADTSQANELHRELLPNIHGLCRSGSISTAIKDYRELVLQEIGHAVRKRVPNSTGDMDTVITAPADRGSRSSLTQKKSLVLSQKLQDLDEGNAETLFSSIFIDVTEMIQRLKAQSSMLLDIACHVGSPNSAESMIISGIQEEMHIALDLPSLLSQGVDASHEIIIKILRARSEQTKSLSLVYFIRYYTLNLLFVNECEAISGQAGMPLRALINGHIQEFIQAHGNREIQELTQAMDVDTWQDTDFTYENNQILRQVLECSTSDPSAWAQMSKIWAPIPEEVVEKMDNAEEPRGRDEVRGATIETETFLLPSSAVLCLKGISNFLRLICSIPSKTPEIASTLVSYLQTFNSRCRQLILGAGALRSAGLRNVTATHLALTSQALSFLSALIPHILGFVLRRIPSGPANADMMSEFDMIHRAFEEHQEGICQKLIDIMESRVRFHSNRAREINWEMESAQDVRKYMVDLTKDTSKLYKAISKRMNQAAVQLIMASITTSYKAHLGTAYKEIDPGTETGRDW
ncbi:hypothetical protein IL306_007529 [Fusarium sp. DS 682]|nr:hypothetical protein IL306_007529 [Fusarium sp. DS 682]